MDGNGYLSKSTTKSVCYTKLPKRDTLSKGETNWLLYNLQGRGSKNHIHYEKLKDVLTDGAVLFDSDDEGRDNWKGFTEEYWAVRQGSVGEWLQNACSPLDRRNFQEFMVMLETFEKERGMDCKRGEGRSQDAIVLRLGPMLSVACRFFVEG